MQGLSEFWPKLLFWVLAFATVGCSVAVVVSQNFVRCAVWLLFALGSTAGLFFLLGADFVGAAQLLIYVGGTLVLVIFGVMLTARGPFVHMKTSSGEWTVAAVVGLALFGVLAGSIYTTSRWQDIPGDRPMQGTQGGGPTDSELLAQHSPTSTQIGLALLGIPPQGPNHDKANI